MKRARRTALMKQSGPYRVESRADGTLVVGPRWQQYERWDGVSGPGFLSRTALAHDIEAFLNVGLHVEQVSQ